MQSNQGPLKGQVKWFNDLRGFGFVTSGSQDYFVHRTGIVGTDPRRTLEEGAQVEFEIVQGAKGLQATNLRVLPSEPDRQLQFYSDVLNANK